MEYKKQISLDKGYKPIGYIYYGNQKIGRCGVQVSSYKNHKNDTSISYVFSYRTFGYVVDSHLEWFMNLVAREAEMMVLLFQTWDRRDICKKFCDRMNKQFTQQRADFSLCWEDKNTV